MNDFAPQSLSYCGVYAAAINPLNKTILTVKKTRGPYNSFLDLPGGSPEPGEDVDGLYWLDLRGWNGIEDLSALLREVLGELNRNA